MKKKNLLIPLLVTFLISSCATVLNPKFSKVSIKSSEKVNLIYEGDTLVNISSIPIEASFRNSNQPLKFDLHSAAETKTLFINRVRSEFYYLNVLTPYWAGFLVDEISSKKWSYPKKIYLDIESKTYLPYFPIDTVRFKSKRSRLSLAPFSSVGIHNPGIEVSFQRNWNLSYSYQLTFKKFIAADTDLARRSKGGSIGAELKYYLRNSEKIRSYFSGNLEYLNKKYEANLTFIDPAHETPDEENIEFFNFNTQIQKNFFSLTPRFGVEVFLTKRLILDGFIGAGLRYRMVEHMNSPTDLKHVAIESDFLNITFESNEDANRFGANLDLNLKIGWQF